MRKLMCFLVCSSLCLLACARKAESPVSARGGKTPDLVTADSGVIASFYDSDNAYTRKTLSGLIEEPLVTGEIRRFEELGYVYSPGFSFVTEGNLEDGRVLEISILALENLEFDARDAVYLVCFSTAEGFDLLPVHLMFSETRPGFGFTAFGDGTWIRAIDLPADRNGENAVSANWSWNEWFTCVLSRTAAGFLSCAVRCRVTLIGYLKCVELCTEGYLITAMILCFLQQL